MKRSLSLLFALPISALIACGAADDADPGGSSQDDTAKDAGKPADAGADARVDASAVDAGKIDKAQLADVAILFPMAKTAAEVDTGYLRATSPGLGGPLLPETVYEAVGKIGGSGPAPVGGMGTAPFANLRVVAMRIDPCFAALNPPATGAGCKNQLRLVFQELTKDGVPAASDSGLHAFYSLSRAGLTTLTKSLIALRLASSSGQRLGALRPHPLVASQGLGGTMARGLRELITRHAGKSNLFRVTTMSATNAGATWIFHGFDITNVASAKVKPMFIPSLPNQTAEQSFFGGFTTGLEGEATPSTSAADNFMPLANIGTATALDAPARKAAFGALLRVENPTKHSPDTMDCVSCHAATPSRKLIAEPKLGLSATGNVNAFVADSKWVLPSELTATFDGSGPLNVHAFS